MEFTVTILGANSAVPAHDRHQTSQVINVGNDLLMIDCGEATQIQLQRYKVKSSKIKHIFISHLHGDHYLGLMGVISTFHLNKRKAPLTIFGPKGLDDIITTQLRYGNTHLNYPLKFIATNPENKELLLDAKRYQVFSFPLKHRLPCTGFYVIEKASQRNLIKKQLLAHPMSIEAINTLKNGKDFKDEKGQIIYKVDKFAYPAPPLRRYVFCSDTIYDPSLVPYIQEADLLYHEATFMENEAYRAALTYHSTAKQAATIAKEAGVKKLLLGHYSTRYQDLEPLLDEAKDLFPCSELSIEGETYTV
ncbi:ribonuclease Z [Echinicola marina]|uniref:ribonuclease Z n=1 Tax=Echinicola marina TaxID=2859768 RepID=UPI001CF700C1|nr:ribonuclease Z [Echinicola marina]UCS92805.1 ribonuclease Z [Echinicola marina]